jgi:phosphonate transport system substrate-binding protein
LTEGIVTVAGTTEGDNALETIFGHDLTGIGRTQDSAYDIIRDLMRTFGWQLEACYRIEFPYFGDDPAGASAAAELFAGLLSQETGLDVLADVQDWPCLGNIVEHLHTGEADIAPLSSVAYALGHDQYGIEAELVNGLYEAFGYRSQINVPAASGYTDIWDLQGTRFASPDPGSTSGYMLPYLLISETTGMTPTQFFSQVDFVGGHDQVIREVYTGTADCGASYDDARSSVEDEYPDVFDVVEVLTYTEYIPNDPWAFREGLEGDVVQALTGGIIYIAGTTEGDTALETIFGYDLTGIGRTEDSAYDIVRDLARAFGWRLVVCYDVYLPTVLRDCCQ